MKERIQEALRRRHRKGDEGFTLIELLVVILIIAILAAVGIVALLSALNSGKKSAAKTTLRNAVTSVKSAQTGLGQTDYTGITDTTMDTEDPDLKWQGGAITGTGNVNVVQIIVDTGNATARLSTRSDNGVCYYALLDSNGPSGYASAKATPCALPVASTVAADDSGTWKTSTKAGWNL